MGKIRVDAPSASSTAGVRTPGVVIPKGALDIWDAARAATGSQLVEVLCVGDSTTYGQTTTGNNSSSSNNHSWVNKLRALALADGLTDGGRGLSGLIGDLNSAQSGEAVGGIQSASGAFSTGRTVSDGNDMLGLQTLQSKAAGDAVTFQGYGTYFRLWYTVFGSIVGPFTYSVDGGTAVEVDPSGSAQTQSVVIGPLTEGLHTITVTNLGGVKVPPPTSLTSVVDLGGGSLAAGTYWYKITWLDSIGGETLPGTAFSGTAAANGKIRVVFNDPWTAAGGSYRLYRSATQFGTYGLVTTTVQGPSSYIIIDDGTVTPGAAPPGSDTSHRAVNYADVRVAFDAIRATGVVFHKAGIPSITAAGYPGVGTAAIPTAAAAFGLTPGQTSGLEYRAAEAAHPAARRIRLGIMLLGGNDQANAAADNSAVVQDSVLRFIRLCQSAGANAVVCIPHLAAFGNPSWSARYVSAITEVTLGAGAVLVNLAEPALGPPSGWAAVGPHLSAANYDTWASILWTQVLSAAAPR